MRVHKQRLLMSCTSLPHYSRRAMCPGAAAAGTGVAAGTAAAGLVDDNVLRAGWLGTFKTSELYSKSHANCGGHDDGGRGFEGGSSSPLKL
jgi:hypothetical protein